MRHRHTNLVSIASLGVIAGMPKTPEESAAFQALCKEISEDAKRRIRLAEQRSREDTTLYGVLLILFMGFAAWIVMDSLGLFN